jgi:membrane-bound lytic murein transglycosylase A
MSQKILKNLLRNFLINRIYSRFFFPFSLIFPIFWTLGISGALEIIAPKTAFAISSMSANNPNLIPSSFKNLPAWNQDHQRDSFLAFKNSCIALIHKSSFKSLCEKANSMPNSISDKEASVFFETYFRPYQVIDPANHKSPEGLFTGYYEPSYPASLTPTSEFNIPIYAKPYHYAEAQRDHSLPNRAQIAHGLIPPNFAPTLGFVRSRVDRFFLQIQGSGILVLPTGQELLVGYAAENGYPYEPIGRDLVQMGEISKKNISMQSIRAWLDAHPSRVDEILNKDPSFVFFRTLNLDEPLGAEGVELTPNSSVAVDTGFTSLGTPVYINTFYPKFSPHHEVVPGKPLQHLFIAQDVGGAIKNPVRADLFLGTGQKAEWLAGHMQSPGEMWVLLPKDSTN